MLALFFIAGQYCGISISTGKHLSLLKRNEEFHILFNKAFTVLNNWPNNYYQFLDWVRGREKNNLPIRQRQKSVLYIAFGKFFTSLFKILSGSQFEFIKRAFIEYLVERWNDESISSLKSIRSAMRPYEGRYISKNDAKRLLEPVSGRLDQLIETRNLKTTVRSKGKKRLVFVRLTDVTKLRESLFSPAHLTKSCSPS